MNFSRKRGPPPQLWRTWTPDLTSRGELNIVLKLDGCPHVTAGEMSQECDHGADEVAARSRAEARRVGAQLAMILYRRENWDKFSYKYALCVQSQVA